MTLRPPLRTALAAWGPPFLGLLAAGCGPGSGADPRPANGGDAQLIAVHHGRLADVFGLVNVDGALEQRLFARDLLIGPGVHDEVETPGTQAGEPRFDFLTPDPDTLQLRLLVLREIGTQEFTAALAALEDDLPLVTPQRGDDRGAVFSVVPRNAALRLSFDRDLGVDDDFFVVRDAAGNPVAARNTEAVQLLEIAGFEPGGRAALVPIPARVRARGRELVIDPVLMGEETFVWSAPSRPAGMPESPNQQGANIRIALALEGPLAIPGLRADRFERFVHHDLAGRRAIVRDFRSGNRADDTALISRGFVRDPERPRLMGTLPFRLADVRAAADGQLELLLWKDGIAHEIDAGDAVAVDDPAGRPILTEVVRDPADDRFDPQVQYVRVRVRRVAGLLERNPRLRPDYPTAPAQVEPWLRAFAPVAALLAPFQALRVEPGTGRESRDDGRWFVRFLPDGGRPVSRAPTEAVQLSAAAVLRFSKPMELGSLRPLDSLFFGTRDLLTPSALEAARLELGIEPALFDADKFRTPHLIGSAVFDDGGMQTVVRVQPLLGFFLDERMRQAAAAGQPFRYFLHLVAGSDGVRDLAGQPLDLGAEDPQLAGALVVPFEVDPAQSDNLVFYSSSRFATDDEDEQPSLYLPDERPAPGNPRAQPVLDLFGNHVLVDGMLIGRPGSRARQIVDNFNQGPAPPQNSPFRWCPTNAAPPSRTAATPFGRGIQNPLNPFGARVQAVWREIDFSLSRTDPADMDLDVERLYWAPFTGGTLLFDEFDSLDLWLGHAEQRPEPCVGNFSALPFMPDSGLGDLFERNYLWNPTAAGQYRESAPDPRAGFVGRTLTIDPTQAVRDPNGNNRFLPLPALQRPFFVWRDQTVREQGGELGATLQDVTDTVASRAIQRPFVADGIWTPYILSPWLDGRGDGVQSVGGALQFVQGVWNNGSNRMLQNRLARDAATGGLLGSIALPLLCDFQVAVDDPALPVGAPFRAFGTNGWQISITVQSAALPAFRAFSGGQPDRGRGPTLVQPGTARWERAFGGFDLQGVATPGLDNSLYWLMADFQKRVTVATAGFIDLRDPHRVPATIADPRLRPASTAGLVPEFTWTLDPPASRRPAGTGVAVEFRGAGPVDPEPWLWREENVLSNVGGYTRPDERNVPLDPRKACDAHIRKFDDRDGRNTWTHYYQRVVTDWVQDANTLADEAFTARYGTPRDPFTPADLRYVGWRLRLTNAVDANPPVSPAVDSLQLAWRLVRRR